MFKDDTMCIIHGNACNNNCCLGKNTIIDITHIRRWFQSPCHRDLCLCSFLFWLLFCFFCLGHYSWSSMVPIMVISYYEHYVSIVVQHEQAIAILQCVVKFRSQSSSLPHIITSASPLLWSKVYDAFLVYGLLFYYCISGVLIVMFFPDMCSHAFICLVLLMDGFPSPPFFYIQGFSSLVPQHETVSEKVDRENIRSNVVKMMNFFTYGCIMLVSTEGCVRINPSC